MKGTYHAIAPKKGKLAKRNKAGGEGQAEAERILPQTLSTLTKKGTTVNRYQIAALLVRLIGWIEGGTR